MIPVRKQPYGVRYNTQRKAAPATVPAPIGGWNARDALTAMKPTDAVILDNWFPDHGFVRQRRGYEEHCDTGTDLPVETLHEHIDGSNRHLLAASGDAIFNVTTGTATELEDGYTNARWHAVNFKGNSILVNGQDTPQLYDGSTIADTVFTGSGLTATSLAGVMVFKERLILWENSSQDWWYAAPQAVAGALDVFPMSMVGTKGGVIVGIATWSVDAGFGPDDLLCIFLSSGQVVIYSGSDPSDATDFGIVGIFNIGEPVHKRAIVKFGADLGVVTRDGYIAMSQVLKSAHSEFSITLSDKITDAAKGAVQSYFSNFGWQIMPYPQGDQLIVNVPVTSDNYVQHVMNIQQSSRAWCRFTGMNSICWAMLSGNPYFGSTDGVVYLADTGMSDDGEPVQSLAVQAWHRFGTDFLKRFTAIRFHFRGLTTIPFDYQINYDFQTKSTYVSTTAAILDQLNDGPFWDVTPWDQSFWGGQQGVAYAQKSAAGAGRWASTGLRIATDDQTVEWYATEYMIEKGGIL